MNKLQKEYAIAKAAYETAFKAEAWDLVDKLEDPMLEAEFALADWTFDSSSENRKNEPRRYRLDPIKQQPGSMGKNYRHGYEITSVKDLAGVQKGGCLWRRKGK